MRSSCSGFSAVRSATRTRRRTQHVRASSLARRDAELSTGPAVDAFDARRHRYRPSVPRGGVPRAARARRAGSGRHPQEPFLCRALGRPLAARCGVRRACVRDHRAIRARSAMGTTCRSPRSLPIAVSWSSHARTRSGGCGSPKSSSGCTRQSISGRWASSLCRKATFKRPLRWFAEAEAVTTRLGWRGPGHRWWIDDHVETLLTLDRLDDAVRILDAWEADARRLGRDRVLAQVTRCRGLVAAARGDVAEAASLLEDAVAQHEKSETTSDGRALCSRSASSAGASGRSAPPATRSARRSKGSSSSARRPGSRRPARSTAGSAAARARRG